MKTIILACETLREELEYCMEKHAIDFEVRYVESGLHNVPKTLRKRVEEELAKIPECDRVLLLFGRCGNSFDKITNGNFDLYMPRIDDCISLLMGSDEARAKFSQENHCYYMTDGWLKGERNVWVEYQDAVEEYGEEEADEIFEMMLVSYRHIGLIDAGVHDLNDLYERTKEMEEKLHLTRIRVPASVSYIEEFLTGPLTPERYYKFGPGQTLKLVL